MKSRLQPVGGGSSRVVYNDFYKEDEFTIDISSQRPFMPHRVSSTFFSGDINSARKWINFKLEGENLSLTTASIKFVLHYEDINEYAIIDSDESIIKDPQINYRLQLRIPNELRNVDSTVNFHVFISFANGQKLDAGVFTSTFRRSFLHEHLPEFKRYNVESFEELKQKLRDKVDEFLEELQDVEVTQGPPGVDGLSAFEIAVENGFVGTEQEWLESLRGADGRDGIDGQQGPQGIQGERGPQGERGQDGINGIDGQQGPQGERGERGEQGIQGIAGTTDFNELDNVPSTFPSTIPQVQNLETELSNIREAILQGSGSGCECPTFPINLNQIDWQAEAISGHVRYIGGNVGINFGRTWTEANPNAAGEHHCNIQMRSQASSLLIRASGVRDSLNRAFFFRPNQMNGPTPDDMILFNDGRLNARVYSEDGILLSDKYTVRLADNAFNANVPITSYPNGRSIHFHSQAPGDSGFPYGTTMIETNRFGTAGIQYSVNLMNGARSRRIWSGISWQGWNVEPTMSMLEKLCEKLDVDINEIMEAE